MPDLTSLLDWLPGIATAVLIVSYGFTDIRWLRLLVVTASVIDIGFYYVTHPAQSMWIDVGRPVVLIGINAYQLFFLYRQARPIKFSAEADVLYRGVFGKFAPGEFNQLLQTGEIETLEPGFQLTRKGSPVESIYALVSGELEARIDGVVINRIVRPATVIGELGYLTRSPASADVVVVLESRALRLSAHAIERFRSTRPDLHLKLAGILGAEIAKKIRDSDARLVRHTQLKGETA